MPEEEQQEQVCGSCGIILRKGNKYTSMGKVISDEDLERICRLSKEKKGCFNMLKLLGITPRRDNNGPFIKMTNEQIEEAARDVLRSLKEKGIETNFEDHFVTLEWIEDARKTQVPLDYKYCATTVLEGLDTNISICIEFLDSLSEGYLTFLRPELVKGITLSGQHFNVLEGNNIMATGYFK